MTNPIRFYCSKCPASFAQFKEIVRHYEREHANRPDARTEKQLDDLRAMREVRFNNERD